MNESALKVIAELYPKYGVELWRHVQWLRACRPTRDWCNCADSDDLKIDSYYEYRIKPNTHIVNGIECPAPLSEYPKIGQSYYYILTSSYYGCKSDTWDGAKIDKNRFKFGIYLKEENLKANLKAHYPHLEL